MSLRASLVAAGIVLFAAVPAVAKQSSKAQKFGAWAIHCEQPEGKKGATLCHLDQFGKTPDVKRPLLRAAVAFVKAGPKGKVAPKLFLITPLGTALPPGLGIQVDNGKTYRVPFLQCFPIGCRTLLDLDKKTTDILRKGKTMTLTFGDPEGRPVKATLSLDGFSAGLDALAKEAK